MDGALERPAGGRAAAPGAGVPATGAGDLAGPPATHVPPPRTALPPPDAPAPPGVPADIWQAARRLCERAAVMEAVFTPLIVGLAPELGGRLDSLEDRLKSAESTARKLASDMQILNIGVAEAEQRIADNLRYIVVLPEDLYVDSAEAILEKVTASGLPVRHLRTTNMFVTGNRYKGVHAIHEVRADDGGPPVKVEIQFHTESSLEIYRATHSLYDIFRDTSRPLHKRRGAYTALVAASEIIDHPPRIDELGEPKFYPPPQV